MIQPGKNAWSADLRIDLASAIDVQDLLQRLVHRYQLIGGVLADRNGQVQAQSGSAVKDLEQLAAVIDVSVLPRYYANGPLDAYVDIVGDDMIALVMRETPAGEERTELTMVSNYEVAKELMEELRAGIKRLI